MDFLGGYTVERIIEDMKNKGQIRTSFILIGHDGLDDEIVSANYLRREA